MAAQHGGRARRQPTCQRNKLWDATSVGSAPTHPHTATCSSGMRALLMSTCNSAAAALRLAALPPSLTAGSSAGGVDQAARRKTHRASNMQRGRGGKEKKAGPCQSCASAVDQPAECTRGGPSACRAQRAASSDLATRLEPGLSKAHLESLVLGTPAGAEAEGPHRQGVKGRRRRTGRQGRAGAAASAARSVQKPAMHMWSVALIAATALKLT